MKTLMAALTAMVLASNPLVAEMAESEPLASGYAATFANLGAAKGVLENPIPGKNRAERSSKSSD